MGTPDQPNIAAVKKYLREFLTDKRVIDIPNPFRWIAVNAFILPVRTKNSAEAYQSIWTEEGSPLLVHSRALQNALAEKLGESYLVELGMRYGNPTISSALDALSACETLHILPLFPQYASASTGSALEQTLCLLSNQGNIPSFFLTQHFYDHPGFILAYANRIEKALHTFPADKILFSYHGLPTHHIKKSTCQQRCGNAPCPIQSLNHDCYRAQCYETSRLLAEKLNLKKEDYVVAFQSRLGKTPWIQPYTEDVLTKLVHENVDNLLVACPSFVADCLETLEEIGIRMKAQWETREGKRLDLVPCLNADPLWVEAVAELITRERSPNCVSLKPEG